MALQAGAKAPDFTLRTMTADGLKDVRLSDNFGNGPTVLLFFPGAFTPPCTQEMCAVSEGFEAYERLGAAVFGISADTPFALDAWAKANGIKVTLLSDYKRAVIAAYDVILPDLAGLGPGSKRAVFVIDQGGIIIHSQETPTPPEMPDFEPVKKAIELANSMAAM